ncbi:sugar ABC transporter ATP-binding protein [Rhizobium sp. LjRoot254]|uniref:sugar ABC transporter ATP-binding protein n=1 Tax=Rhizobium sp. LjRoot254 TaxID=3342297 RepID=UPI003ED15688
MLAMSGISKSYGPIHALSNVSFSAGRGSVTALLGENGAGKSTLVKILSGLVAPTSGSVSVDGKAVDLSTPGRARRAGVAVVQQEISVLPNLTVAENFMLTGGRHWLSRRKAAADCRTYLARLGLDHLDPATPVSALSIGERQLVEVARMLSQSASVLVLDEPSAALADHDIALVHQAVRRLAREGNIVLYITHRLNELEEICDQAVVLRNGKLADQFPVKAAGIPRIVQAMIGRELDQLFPDVSETRYGDRSVALELDATQTAALAAPVTLKLRAGEIVATCGQLGSGFVEPIRAVAGKAELQAGAIYVHGTPLLRQSHATRADAGIAYCSDDRQLDGFFHELPVWETLSAPQLASRGLMKLTNSKTLSRSVNDIAERMTILPAYRQRKVRALSGGNAQKVSIGKWLSRQPRVLLLEEPTRGVDVGARAEIYTLLRSLADEGLSILFASTDLDEVLGFSERIFVFHDRRLVRTAAAGELDRNSLVTLITHGASHVH